MPRLVVPAAALLALASAGPVFAGAGLPRLGEMQAGPYTVALYNDSPTLVTGRNLLTIEIPDEAAAAAQLTLVGARGQTLDVPLNRVKQLGHAGGDGAAHGDGHPAGGTSAEVRAPSPPAHDASSHVSDPAHGAATAGRTGSETATGAGESTTGGATLLRGRVNVPSAGTWIVRVGVAAPGGEVHTDEILLEAARGGPSRLYLLTTGTVIVGALMVGFIGRRQLASTQSVGRSA